MYMLTFYYSMQQINKLIQLSVKIKQFPLGIATVKRSTCGKVYYLFLFLIILSHLVNVFFMQQLSFQNQYGCTKGIS